MVVNELEYQGKPRKWLAEEVGIDVSTIGTGIRRKSIPQADIALRISKALNVSLDYLLSGVHNVSESGTAAEAPDYSLYCKYHKILENLEKISPEQRKAIINLISVASEENHRNYSFTEVSYPLDGDSSPDYPRGYLDHQ